MAFDPLQILVGAVIGAAAQGSLRWWQYRRDLWLQSVETFCDAVEKAADLATEHWLFCKDGTPESDDADRSVRGQEIRLIGLQARLDAQLAMFSERLSDESRGALESAVNRLSDGMMGGDFGSKVRSPDPERAREAQILASELVVVARRSASTAITVGGFMRFLRERRDRRYLAAEG